MPALSPKKRLKLLEKVFKKGESVTSACREFSVSRFTFYKWAKRYDPKAPRNKNLRNLADIRRKVVKSTKLSSGKVIEEVKNIASEQPHWSKYKITNELKKRMGDKAVGVHGVYNVLKRTGLNTLEARKRWQEFVLKSKKRLLTPEQRLEIIKKAEELGITVTQVCRDFGISRFTYYKWKKRWEESGRRDDALRDRLPKFDRRHLRVKPELEKEILSIVIEFPNLSKYGIARRISEKLGPVVGPHGIYNVLLRNGLNKPEERLAYSSTRAPEVAAPETWTDRLRYVLEQFVPSLAPAPPPGLSIALNFLKTFSLASVISSATIYSFLWWIDLLAQQVAQVSIGLVFASIALLMGSLFFLYSLKYYITLAIVLSFSQKEQVEGYGEQGKKRGFFAWLLGLGNGRRNGEASGSEGQKIKSIGLEPNLEHITLKRQPFVSVHIPLYNEKNVVERILSASSNFEYPEYEVILADDSNDETSQIIRDYLNKFKVPRPRQAKRGGQSSKFKVIRGEGWTMTQAEIRPGVVLKHLHRASRSGFKGGALKEALKHTDKKAEFVTVFDADFVPYPDTLELFLKYFQATAGTLDFQSKNNESRIKNKQSLFLRNKGNSHNSSFILHDSRSNIAAVQGYQWHVLNKSENWITRGVRSEYAGSYVIERSGEEIYGGLKQISGAVYMIRRDVLQEVGWDTSITEDFQLTLKLYEKGYKVVYTPYIQAPAECVSTLQRLIKQRMRWAEGHSNNIRRMFMRLMLGKWEVGSGRVDNEMGSEKEKSHLSPQHPASHLPPRTSRKWTPSPLTVSEKLEFLYLSPYYLQAFFFLVGTISWLLAETLFPARLPFWTSLWGWSLVLTNLISLPLMNAVGLFLEESEERDYAGLASFIALTYILVPFQAYASIKGFLEQEEGPWFRTPKTGRITDVFARGRFYRFISGILPGRRAPAIAHANAMRMGILRMDADARRNPYLALTSANSKFDTPPVQRSNSGQSIFDGFLNFDFFGFKGVRIAKRYLFTKAVLASFLAIVMLLNYLALFVYQRQTPISTDVKRISTDEVRISTDEETRVSADKFAGGGSGGGQVISEVGTAVNTNLVENPKALALITQTGDVLAAESPPSVRNEVYRWEVDFARGTTYSFGLQEPGGILPVVRIRSHDWWYVRFAPRISTDEERISTDYVEPKVEGNTIQWELQSGITAKYTALRDRIKADYIVPDESALISGNISANPRMDFIVQYNDTYAGDTPEDVEANPEGGYLAHELLPEGDISWFGENGREVFSFPRPIITDSRRGTEGQRDKETEDIEGSFEIIKLSQGTSLLSIILPQDKLDSAVFPITIDPVVIDVALDAFATAYGNGRYLLRDSYGNLITIFEGGALQDIWYKSHNSTSWTDAGVGIDSPAFRSGDVDTLGNIHVASNNPTTGDTRYRKLTVSRNADNSISGISVSSLLTFDDSDLSARPSLIVANKGEGSGKEKIAVAWAMNSSKGGTKRGEIRFLQCDVADDCTSAANWKNASEERNGSGTCSDTGTGNVGLPNALDCRGAADVIFQYTPGHTNHHGVLTQVPGRPARTPDSAKLFDGGASSYTDLSNAIDDNTGTDTGTNLDSLTTNDYIYIGDANVYSRLVVDMLDASVNSSNLFSSANVEFCSGVDGSNDCNAWTDLVNFIDNTATATVAFSEDGTILFDEPSSWVTGDVNATDNKYWIRLQPAGAFDSDVAVVEFDVTDRHAKDLLIVGGNEDSPFGDHYLGAAYVIWDGVDQDKWENIPGNTFAPAPWRENGTAVNNTGAAWNIYTDFPLSATPDLINNIIYLTYVSSISSGILRVDKIENTEDLTVNANWTDTSFPAVTEAADIVLSLTSDQNDIYLFYVLDPGTNSLVWRKCDPGGGGDAEVCDNSADWGSEKTLDEGTNNTHPQAIVSKAYGDGKTPVSGDPAAIDVIFTTTTTPAVEYGRHYMDLEDQTEVVAASGDDAYHRDCDTGTDDQNVAGPTVTLGREADDAGCNPTTVESENHVGFRFTTVNIAPGANISSAYLDFRVRERTGSTAVDFTVYGEDVDDSAAFSALTNCTDPCSGAVGERTRTTTSTTQSTDFAGGFFSGNSYRFEVTDMVQEVVCRGASDAQPCVGNLNGTGAWAANNDLALLLISAEGGTTDNFADITAQDDTATLMLDPTLQINCAVASCGTGNAGQNYSIGVEEPKTGLNTFSDLDHPMESNEFTMVNTDDDKYATISASLVPSASSSATPIFMLKNNNSNNNNTDDLQVTAIVKSTIPTKSYGGPHPGGKTIYLQVYRNGSTDDWVTQDSDTTTVPDTDITLSANITASQTEYYQALTSGANACTSGTPTSSSNNCWSIWRVYQDAAPEANQILYADFWSITFIPENVLWLLPLALFLPRVMPTLMKRLGLRQRRKYATVKSIT